MLVALHLPDILGRNRADLEIYEEEATGYVIVEDKTPWKQELQDYAATETQP